MSMRREFELGPADTRALDALGCPWETIKSAGTIWIILHDFTIPPGFNITRAKVAIRIDSYPPGPLDMAYFHPPLARTDGKQINNLSEISLEGQSYQQWSRHYSWSSAIHTLSSHIRRIRGWLKHEFRKR